MDQSTKSSTIPGSSSSLRSNLVALYKNAQRIQYNESNSATNTNIPQQQYQQGQRCSNTMTNNNNNNNTKLVRNPHSILSTEPKQLSKQLQIRSQDVLTLRKTIAKTIVQNDVIGNKQFDMNTISMIRNNQKRKRNDDVEEEYESSNDRNKFINIPTAVTAHELYSLSSMMSSSNYRDQRDNNHQILKITTGSHQLDQLISSSSSSSSSAENNNGIALGSIMEICGISSSGKTQLALSIAANAILQQISSFHETKFQVHYITGGGSSSSLLSLAKRFRQLCKVRVEQKIRKINEDTTTTTTNNDKSDDYDDILDQIKFIPVNDNAYHLLSALNEIEHEMVNGSENNILIVVDSISGSLSSSLYIDGDGGTGLALMNEISLILRRLSRWKKIIVPSSSSNTNNDDGDRTSCCECAILITNGMVSDNISSNKYKIGGGYKPALGELWRVADIRLVLYPIQHEYGNDEKRDNSVTSHTTAHYDQSRGNKGKDIAGLKRSRRCIVNATLEKHYKKYCHPSRIECVRFGIDHAGIVDI